MSNHSFDQSVGKQTGARNGVSSRMAEPRIQTPSLLSKSQKDLNDTQNVLQVGTQPALLDQSLQSRNIDLYMPSMDTNNEVAIVKSKQPEAKDDQASQHSTAESGEDGSSEQVLIPPANFKRCEGEDLDTVMIENDRLRYIIQTLNQRWQMSGPQMKIGDLTTKIADLMAELAKSKLQNKKLKAEIDSLKNELSHSETQVISLKQVVSKSNTVIAQQRIKQQKMDKQLDQMHKDLTQKHNELKKSRTLLQAKAKDFDDMQCMLDCYIAHKNDETDKALAKEINEFPEKEKLQILFLRESEGVYKFGSQQVHLKVGKNKQVKVRVGGGFMSISQFIEKYTEVEKQKIQRGDVATRFNNKLKMQQLCTDLASNKAESIAINESQVISVQNNSFMKASSARRQKSTTMKSFRGSPLRGSPSKANDITRATDQINLTQIV